MRNLTLLTDFYEITMGYGFFKQKKHEEEVVFDIFFRQNKMITYSLFAGLEQAMDYLLNWHFSEDDIAYLRSLNTFDEEFLEYLKNMRFTGDVYAVKEGEPVFPGEPILTINALSCADGVLIPVKTDYLAYRGLTQLQDSIREIQELINPDLKVLGVIATLYDARVSDDKDILALLKEEYNLVGVVKRLAVAKKGIYDGLAVVEQAPSSEIAKEYTEIAKMIINGNFDREDIENG